MWTTLKRLLGSNDTATETAATTPLRSTAAAAQLSRPGPPPVVEPTEAGAPLSKRLIEFVDHLSSPPPLIQPEELTSDDILFLEGLVRRLQRAQLEIAILPEITVRLTDMLRHGNVPVGQYVDLLSQDNALSIEVLKTANSALYANAARTTSLHEAVMRIGLTRLQGILMLSLMKTRVLKAGTLRGHAELLIDMALPLAAGATAAARARDSSVDLCFMRAMLLHVEHLLILSTISDTAREHRAVIVPSTGALMLAFERSGADVRSSLALGWALEEILLHEDGDPDRVDYAAVRRAVICRWLRRPLPELEGVSPDVLERALASVAPRVPEPEPPMVTVADANQLPFHHEDRP